MGSPGSGLDPIDSITFQLSGLEITVSARRLPGPAGANQSTSSAVSVAEGISDETPPPVDTPEFSVDLIRRVRAARTAAEFSQVANPHPVHLVPRFRGGSAEWTASARLARAFRAGLVARQRLDGVILEDSSCAIPYRNTIYIVLRARGGGAGFWTRDYNIYSRGVFVLRRGQEVFDPESISHAFATLSEGTAYLSGAQVEWPPAREQ